MTSNDLARLKDFQRRFPVIDTRERKIFVYRSDPVGSKQYTQRGLHKQEQTIKELLNEGFQLVSLEDLSLQDQIQLFSGAQHIAGFHGAGLANQIWMPPGGRVTEFVGNRRTQHFRHLARLGGHDYTEKLID